MIPNETVNLVRERVDIVEVIGECVELRRAGANYKGLCPFHQEKTPSFNVNGARQMYHCFGCGAGGDVFTFLMSYEGRTFTDAVRTLAERANVPIEEVRESPARRSARERQRAEQERLIEVVEIAASFYRSELEGPKGQRAREYLEKRGLDRATIEAFGLGYAPAEWDALSSRLSELSVRVVEAETVGLIARRRTGEGHYDRFRDRVIFPVYDAAGRVVALGGRVLPGADKEAPKYVNSPESPIYSKGRTLYGLFRARSAFRRKEPPILVEGNVDVIAMHAHGFASAVAPMGTALTSEQVMLLRRFAGRDAAVTLLFDGDDAGRQAALRAQPALAEGGLGARVALLPPSEDPDSFLRREGPEALQKLIDGAQGLNEHLIGEAARQASDDAHGKVRGIRSLAPLVQSVQDPMERDLYRRTIARAFRVSEDAVFRHLRMKSSENSEEKASERPQARKRAEGAVTGVLLDFPILIEEAVQAGVLNLVTDRKLRWILDKLKDVASEQCNIESLAEQAPNERIAERLRARIVAPKFTDVEIAREEMHMSLAKLQGLTEREQDARLQQEIDEAEKSGDSNRAIELAQMKLLRKKKVVGISPDGTSGR